MTQETPPPPLPQSSSKRILPAFLLCFTICAHRIYAGKYISGIIQMGVMAGSLYWVYPMLKKFNEIMGILNSGSLDDTTMDKLSNMQGADGGMPALASLVVLGVGVWVAVDAAKLLRGKFTDGQGNKITRWW